MKPSHLNLHLLRGLWSLSWPTVIYSLLESMVGIVDIYLASFLGEDAVAAIGFSRQIFLVLMIGTLSITTGTIAMISQSYGARCYDSASSIASHSLVLSIISGLFLGIVGVWCSRYLLIVLGAKEVVLSNGVEYLQVLMGGVVFLMINFSTNGIFRAQGDTVTPLKIASLVNGFNIIFSYALIFGIGPLPAFGVMGVALGTILARAVGAVWGIYLLTRRERSVRIRMRDARDISLYHSILKIGLPSGFAGFFRNGARILFFRFVAMTSLGTISVAVASIGFQLRMLSIMPALAFQVATATLVGQSIGAQKIDRAEAYGWTAIYFCSGVLALASMGLIFFPRWIMGLFTESPEAIEMGRWVLYLIALEQFCSSMSIIVSGALNGAGDTRPAMNYTIVSQWILMLPAAYLLAFYTSWDVLGAWLAWGLAPIVQFFLILRRFIQGNWKRLRIPCAITDFEDQ